MRTTVDATGRIVVPPPFREAMGLTPGSVIEMVFTDGHLRIEPASVEVDLDTSGRLPRLVANADQPPLADQQVRDALDATRR